MKLLLCLALCAISFALFPAAKVEAAPLAGQVFSASLLPSATCPPGTEVNGTSLTASGVKWSANQGVTISDKGATSSVPGGAHHRIDNSVAGTIHVHADVDAEGSGFTGVALGRGDLSSNFWANLSLLLYVGGDRYNLLVDAKDVIPNIDKTLLHADGLNALDLLVNTVTRTVRAKINNQVVLSDFPLPANVNLADITSAGFRFNEPVAAGKPSVSNYSADVSTKGRMKLTPTDVGMFFLAPNKAAKLRWRVSNPDPGASLGYVVKDYAGYQTSHGTGILSSDGMLTITEAFPRGYSEIFFPSADQTFGLVALNPHVGPADPFFCMDSALSGLEPDLSRRASLIESLARSGVALSRERMNFNLVIPSPDTVDWEGTQHLDSIRKTYAQHKVPILEMLDANRDNLPGLAQGIKDAAQHWQIWGGAEASNEPDITAAPADQYLPLVKTISYALKEAHSQVPLVSGVFATSPPGPFFDTCLNNGLLDDSDAVSFHSYDRAGDVEGYVSRYRTWLKKGGKEAMPLWHTECGWSWVLGPPRPPQDQDAASALEIAAKAVESRACGVARYFPFVYVYYEEGKKNFGMMGRDATPLRSMAAYAACIQTLSDTKYLGDIQGLDRPVKLARVFGSPGDANCVAVIYTGVVAPGAEIPFPIKAVRVAGADGRALAFDNQAVPIPDGLVYVYLNRASLTGKLDTKTHAMSLYQIGQHPLIQERRASPLVFQFLPQETPSRASARGYLITQELAHKLPVSVRISNLSSVPVSVTLEIALPGKAAEKSPLVTVPAVGHRDISWSLDAASQLDIAQTRFISLSGASDGVQPLPLAIPFVMNGTSEQHLARHKNHDPLPITDLSRWSSNISSIGRTEFLVPQDGTWRASVTFTGNGDKWAYPKFTLPAKIDTALYSGFLIRARVLQNAGGVAIIAESDNGSPSFWVPDLFPPDGEWHVVYVPFSEFKVGPGGAGDQNTRLDPAAWKRICLGMGSHTSENAFEMSQCLLVGGDSD